MWQSQIIAISSGQNFNSIRNVSYIWQELGGDKDRDLHSCSDFVKPYGILKKNDTLIVTHFSFLHLLASVAFLKPTRREPEIIICRQQKLKSSSNWFNYQLNFVPCYVYPKWAAEWVSGCTYNSYYTEYLTRLFPWWWWRSTKRLLSNEQPSTGTRKEAQSLLMKTNWTFPFSIRHHFFFD